MAQELPWYQTLDQRVTILAVSATGLALLMILAALRGLHRLNKKPAPPQRSRLSRWSHLVVAGAVTATTKGVLSASI